MSESRHFQEMLRARCEDGRGLGLSLDSDLGMMTREFKDKFDGDILRILVEFNKGIIWQTHSYVCAYMADHHFYLQYGVPGLQALQQTVRDVHAIARGVPFVLGCYAGGVRHSNVALARYAFDVLGADAITINPWFGLEAMEPLVSRPEKGVLVTCRTSNYGAAEFQDSRFQDLHLVDHDDVPLYQGVAHRVSSFWDKNRNCGLLMGPMTYGELARVRGVANGLPIFVTGIGTQGKSQTIQPEDVDEIVINGGNDELHGSIVCAARSVIFAPGSRGPHDEAVRLHDLINQSRAKRVATLAKATVV